MKAGLSRRRDARRPRPARDVSRVRIEVRRLDAFELAEEAQQLARARRQRLGQREMGGGRTMKDGDGAVPGGEQLSGDGAGWARADHEHVALAEVHRGTIRRGWRRVKRRRSAEASRSLRTEWSASLQASGHAASAADVCGIRVLRRIRNAGLEKRVMPLAAFAAGPAMNVVASSQ